MEVSIRNKIIKILWVSVYLSVLIWSAIQPKDYVIWFLEVSPAIIGGILLLITYRSFHLTTLLYFFILMHCLVLMVGGHYTYSEVPLFDWLKEVFDLERNNYDKVGHFMQGFVPALLAREILIRKQAVNGAVWLNLFIITISLAFSAFYELIEWWVAVISSTGAEEFLATQGYVWDTQSDMAWALAGAIICIITLSRIHDSQIKNFMSNN